MEDSQNSKFGYSLFPKSQKVRSRDCFSASCDGRKGELRRV